jgi:hypothetical protein
MGWAEKERHALALLINEASYEGEWQTAAAKLRVLLLQRKATVNELTGNGTAPAAADGLSRANWGAYRMPDGCRKGEMFADIDLRYLIATRDSLVKLKDRRILNGRNVQLLEALSNYLRT